MNPKLKTALTLVVTLFAAGTLLLLTGLLSGTDMAVAFSRPADALMWTTPQTITQAFTYVPAIAGTLLMLTASLMAAALFRKWLEGGE